MPRDSGQKGRNGTERDASPAPTRIDDWVSFWDRPHAIYVSERHADIHYRDIADAIMRYLPGPDARVLDYGCGEARHAETIAAAAGHLFLCEAAPSVRRKLAARFDGVGKIEVIAPESLPAMPDQSLDLIVVNSVVQYLSRDELLSLLAQWRRLLAPGGTLVIGDVIPPDASAWTDLTALLRYARANGFLPAALFGVLRTAASPYRKLRATHGLARYGDAEFVALLQSAGFAAERQPVNIEHNQARMTFVARPADGF
ncbi:MAG: methyltransferase domain-containing protein [Xanthobacteraceae bacterium]